MQDLTAQLNAGDRTIERLQKQLATLRAETQTDAVRATIAAVTAHIVRLQRQQAATVRAAHYATVQMHLETPPAAQPTKHGHGPLHGLGVAFHWIWIGAVYAAALGRRCSADRPRVARRADDPAAAGRRAAQPAVIRAITRNVGSPTGSSENSGLTQPRSGSARLS